ncbi:OadG family protein [Cloacibacillus porcorum]|uniref:OadG family protein n=1 Tax=Cloacibacillus porcorum TaxID=1197717 RepID=UPI0014595E90|nr:OadG family protein [Cloacibacillus porcorum]MCC8185549.1 OadG family protein [Cloacibacillus porcorum]MDY5389653.1 OadG family protein [Cloacibacillus porcorum]NMF17405.1 OadG family protein [Cloacibacillus porcorum]
MTGHISSYFVGVTGGLTMSFIAFSIVFIVIVGLMLVMMGMKHVCAAIDNMSKPKPATTAQPSPAAPAAPAAAVSADDDELLAVISAAIMAACGSTARVVAFSPVKAPVSTAWKNVGRLQNTEGC